MTLAGEDRFVNLLPRARPVELTSAVPPGAVLDRLRWLAANWRGSSLAGPALQAGIYGWLIEERRGGLVVRPRPNQSGAAVAIFEGNVDTTPSGSRISGRIRLHPLARVFLIVILAAAVLMPVGALFESVPLEDWHHHVVRAGQMLAIGTVIAVAGILMLGGGLHVLGRHIVAFLDAAAQAGGKSTPT